MKKYMFIIMALFTVSLILISCDGASDNGEENNNEDSGANRDDFNSSDLVDIRTAESGDQAENKVLNETAVLGYYGVLDDLDVNEEFSAAASILRLKELYLLNSHPMRIRRIGSMKLMSFQFLF